MHNAHQRLLSLDALRGLTVAMMILVNNGWGETFTPLEHCHWNGMTPCDLVFPFFLFMVGVSIHLSLSRHQGEQGMVAKILKRTAILFFIGVALHAWDMALWGDAASIPGHLRIWGVLQRIALSYGAAALFVNAFKGKYLWRTIISLLTLYGIILIWGNGYSENPDENLLSIVDRQLFGNHLYVLTLRGDLAADPEGLVGVIAGIAHALIGVACGRALTSDWQSRQGVVRQGIESRMLHLLIIAAAMGICGYLLSFGLPLNKSIWSPSYCLVSCSLAASTLALFTYLIDMQGHKRWCKIFQMFGMNTILIYTLSEMSPSLFGISGISNAIHDLWVSVWGLGLPKMISLSYALTIDLIMAFVAWILYRRRIFVKV